MGIAIFHTFVVNMHKRDLFAHTTLSAAASPKPIMPQVLTYRTLLQAQWLQYFRSKQANRQLFVWFILGIMGLYVSFTLVTLGLFFDRFAFFIEPGADPVVLFNRYLLGALFGLFGIRFLFQRTPGVKIQPYLHLPIGRKQLVRFFQATSLFSIHNLYPLLFIVPFWYANIAGSYPALGAAAWLIGLVLFLIASNYANLFIRSVLTRHENRFLVLMGMATILLYLDQLAHTYFVEHFSRSLFGGLLSLDLAPLLLLSILPIWMVFASDLLLRLRLQKPVEAIARPHTVIHLPFLEKAGPAGQLLLLEGRLMWRNRRPRHYLLISLLFSTLYLIFLLATPGDSGGLMVAAVIGLFASGGFAMNYGQLMFSWESAYFDGLLARNVSSSHLIRNKMFILQGSCVILFLISLPLFIWFRPDLIRLHIAFLFYNAGITSILVMFLALRNRQSLDLSKSGGFLNYEGFSAMHWLWFFPTALPPVILLVIFRMHPNTGLLLLGGLGGINLMLYTRWREYFTACLERRKYGMAAGFRN